MPGYIKVPVIVLAAALAWATMPVWGPVAVAWSLYAYMKATRG